MKILGKATISILVAVVVGLSTFVGITFNASSKVGTNDNLNISEQSDTKYLDLNNIKFNDTKLIEEDGAKILLTKLQNDSNEKIVNVKYIYDVDNDIISLEKADEIMPGATSDTATIKVNENIMQNDVKLIKAYVTVEDHNNQLLTVEYVQNI